MHSEKSAAEQNRIHVMEPWPDEPGKKAGASPFQSIGGYLNYAGWSECQRFMDLDRLIQLHGHESQNTEGVDASNDGPAESYPEDADHGYPFRKRSCLASDYPDTNGPKDWTRPIFGDVIKGLEDLSFRRL
jgi:hypothetical protein